MAKKSGNVTQHWEDEIDVMVYKLYDLSYAEAKIIDDKLEEDYFNSIVPYRRVSDPSVQMQGINNSEIIFGIKILNKYF